MKYSTTIALLVSQVTADCRNDYQCSINWFKTKCCGDFDCSTFCNTTRTKISSCGKKAVGKKASDFKDYTVTKNGRKHMCRFDDDEGRYSNDQHDRFDTLDKDDFDLSDDDKHKVKCTKGTNGKLNCRDHYGRKRFCTRRYNGTLDCSDDNDFDEEEEELTEAAALTPAKFWRKRNGVTCTKNAAGWVSCTDDNDVDGDFHVRCHKDTQGRTVCQDSSDNKRERRAMGKRFCRVVRGQMTCSDNDHSDWWAASKPAMAAKPLTKPAAVTPAQFWKKRNGVTCTKNAAGWVSCTDDNDVDGDFHVRCHKDTQGRTVCRDSSDNKRESRAMGKRFCRVVRGQMTCSDNDHSDWWAASKPAMAAKPAAAGQKFWNDGSKVHCKKTGKFLTCKDSDGFNAKCRKDAQHRLKCNDSEGREEFCNYKHGKMSCSDNDKWSHHRSAKTATTSPKKQWWKKAKVACRLNAKGSINCNDSEGFHARCIKRANGRLDCTDDDKNQRFCRYSKHGIMSCSDDDNNTNWTKNAFDWDMAAEEQFEAMIQQMSSEFMI